MDISDGLDEEIITNQQSGFRSLHSTTALWKATVSWAFDIDRGNVNVVVFVNFKKAFDSVDDDGLLAKLSLYGIQESAYDWFKSHLKNRTQKCAESVVSFPKSILWAVGSLRKLS